MSGFTIPGLHQSYRSCPSAVLVQPLGVSCEEGKLWPRPPPPPVHHFVSLNDFDSRHGPCMMITRSVSVRPVGSGGGFGVGLQAGLRGERKRRSRPASPAQGRRAGPPPVHILPASHYYRYYGAAGQGAKTSGGYARRP